MFYKNKSMVFMQKIVLCLLLSFCLILPKYNNVYAAYENIASFSVYGRTSYSGSASGSMTWTSPNIIDFRNYTDMYITGKEHCYGSDPSHAISVYAIDSVTNKKYLLGTGSWGASKYNGTWMELDYKVQLYTPSCDKGYLQVVYTYSSTCYKSENGSSWGNSSLDGTFVGTLNPKPRFEQAFGNLTHIFGKIGPAAVLKCLYYA